MKRALLRGLIYIFFCVIFVTVSLFFTTLLPLHQSVTALSEAVEKAEPIRSSIQSQPFFSLLTDTAADIPVTEGSHSAEAQKAPVIINPTSEFADADNVPGDSSFVYFAQGTQEYAAIPYGDKTIYSYGCGPVNMAMIITSLTRKYVSPVTLCRQSEEWGCFVSGSGTSYSFFGKAAAFYGIKCSTFNYTRETLEEKLKSGYVICVAGKGYFSRRGHFLTIRGFTENGKVLIADSYSLDNTLKEWDLDYLIGQLKSSTMWSFSL